MSAIIRGGTSGTDADVDSLAKASRVVLYDGTGKPISGFGIDTGRGSLSVFVRQSATTAAGASVWAVRNTHATKKLYITRVVLQLSFDGTGAASLMRYELLKGTGNTALTGGAVVTPVINENGLGQSLCSDARVLDTGLTVTGVTFGGVIQTFTQGRITPAATVNAASGMLEVIEWPIGLELLQNEVLAIRNGPTNASVIGDTVFGRVNFVER